MKKKEPVSYAIYVLVILFGSSTWLSVSGVWVQMPLMVTFYGLPEGWHLPSYLAVIVQLAVIGPVVHWIAKKLCPGALLAKTSALIYTSLIFSTFATLALALFWDKVFYVFHQYRSLALFIALFFVSLSSCTSSVLYLPNMFRFRHNYVTAYFVGMGFSSLVPSALALLQGAGRTVCHSTALPNDTSLNLTSTSYVERTVEPNFDVSMFFGLITVWMTLCTIAFYLLNKESLIAKALNDYKATFCVRTLKSTSTDEDVENMAITSNSTSSSSGACNLSTHLEHTSSNLTFGRLSHFVQLMLTFWTCFLMNGVLASILSYASLPYGSTAFHLSTILAKISNPFGCFALFFINVKRTGPIIFLTVIATSVSAYLVFLALESPHVVFGYSIGAILCVIAAVISESMLAYIRAACASLLRQSNDENLLWWCGIFTQAGSFVGSLLMFPLVNVYPVFESAKTCQ